ncbi:hypothetical protein BHE74_00020208 [Ensete ventricosum]|nr:hypothetical protein BHE74_00020208 [Ensete ventricosum]
MQAQSISAFSSGAVKKDSSLCQRNQCMSDKNCEKTRDACRYFLMESGFALFVALLINIAVVSVSGTVCAADSLSSRDSDRCSDLTLNSASFLLKVCPFN